MTGNLASARTLCLLDEKALCNPIWVSQANGLKLVHFPTLSHEMAEREDAPFDAAYEKCERLCLQISHPR